MTIPTTPQKRFLAAGAIKAANGWGTATAMGDLNGMLIKEDGGLKITRPYQPANEADAPFVLEGDLGNIEPVDFAIGFSMRYDPTAIGVLIAQLFGTASPEPTPVGYGYAHTLQWKDHNYGQFVTFAIERPRKIFEVASAKVYSLDLSIADGFLEGSLGLRGNTLINDSAVNGFNQMDALTYRDKKNRIKFSQISVKMNAEVDGTLVEASALEVSDLSIHYERPHDALHAAGSPSIIEPMENGPPIITVTLNFPRMNDDNDEYFALFNAETEQKLEVCATGVLISGDGYNYNFTQQFPRMRIIDIDYPFDDIVPGSIILQAEQAAAVPTGLVYKRPCVYWRNKRSTNYLT